MGLLISSQLIEATRSSRYHSFYCNFNLYKELKIIFQHFVSCSKISADRTSIGLSSFSRQFSFYWYDSTPGIVWPLLPCSSCPVSSSASSSVLRAPQFQLSTFLYAWCSGECVHSGVFIYLMLLRCKVVFCRPLNQWVVCHCKFLKLSSQVRVEWSVGSWNSGPYKYLWMCSSVFTMASNSQWVTQ